MALSVPLHCFLLLKYIIFSGVCSSRFSCKNCHLTSMWVYVFANCHYETKHLCFCIHTHTPHTCTQMSSGHFSDAAGVCLFCSPRKIRKEVSMAGWISFLTSTAAAPTLCCGKECHSRFCCLSAESFDSYIGAPDYPIIATCC